MSLAVVQVGSACSNSTVAPAVTLGSAPTQGDLLLCAGFTQGVPGAPGTNWIPLGYAYDSGGTRWAVAWYKYAQASESATQTPNTGALPAWGITMWEVSGVTGNIGQDLADFVAQTQATGAITPFSTSDSSELLFFGSAVVGVSGAPTISISGGGTWTSDASSTGIGGGYNQGAHGWRQALMSSGANINPTLSATASAFQQYFGAIGLTTAPTSGCPYPVQAQYGDQGDGTVVSVTLPKAPTQGNLLLATVNSGAAVPTADTGWTLDTSATAGSQHTAVFYKYAGASESATQTPCTDTATTLLCHIVEIAGVGGSWSTDHIATHIGQEAITGGTSPSPVTFTTGANNELVSGLVIGATLGAGPLTGSGSGTPLSAFYNSGLGGANFGGIGTFAYEPTSGASFSQAFDMTSAWFAYAYVELVDGSSNTETATANLGLNGVSFAAAANDHRITTTLALSKVSFGAGGGREETAQGTITLDPIAFAAAAKAEVIGTGTLVLSGVAIAASAIDFVAGGGSTTFSTFGA